GALERSLKTRLVNRDTRNVSLTTAGQRYYERCRQILADLDDAETSIGESNVGVSGTLKIAAPIPFGLTFVSPRVARFQQRHPGLDIDLDLRDEPSDLVKENIDVAIRLGHLARPGLIARKLGESSFVMVGSPAYFARRGTP